MESQIEFFIKPGCYTNDGSPNTSDGYTTVLTVNLNGEIHRATAMTPINEFAHLTPEGQDRLRFRLIGCLGDAMMGHLRKVILREVNEVREQLIESRRMWPREDK